ncbi:MAG: DUF4012 domain-containing protein [Patescibacteria group bacterium]
MPNQELTAEPQPDTTVHTPESSEQSAAAPSRMKTNSSSSIKQWWGRQNKKVWLISSLSVFGVLLVVVGVLVFATYTTAKTLQAQAVTAQATARTAYDQFKAQDLPGVKSQLEQLDQQLVDMRAIYARLGFYRYIPIARNYYKDGSYVFAAGESSLEAGHKMVAAVEPYADVLGFTGEEETELGTTEDRVCLVLQTLQHISPELDEITADLSEAEMYLSQIDASRYPESFRGREIRGQIIQVQELSAAAIDGLTEFRPVIEQLPSIAGATEESRRYLVLFQNDNELRPTGGFLTAYAIINVENGKVTPEKSDDIYDLDQRFNERLPIPDALGRYLTTEQYWNLRDMNISPDFKTSMDTFFSYYQDVPGEPEDVDGIIAIDTEFLTRLVAALGPVEVPGYGVFSAEIDERCDCPQIIYVLSEIITRPTPYIREDRKGIIGPMMQAILAKTYAAPKVQLPELIGIGYEAVQNRHIQLYFLDEENQRVAEVVNAAGRMKPPEENEDFFAVINANLGGAKSNLFVEYSMDQTVSAPENGRITKTVDITYRNTRPGDNCNLKAGLLCLNSTLRDWTRFYLPEGSELVSANGFTQEPQVYDEAGFTVIDSFFILEPNGSSRVSITYTVPYTDPETYRLKLWKQGGVAQYEVLMDVTGGQELLEVVKDTEYQTVF